MFGDNMEQTDKKEICESCKSCNYDVEADMQLCKENQHVPIHIVVQHMTCPLKKW